MKLRELERMEERVGGNGESLRVSGWLCLAAGVSGVAAAAYLLWVPPAVGEGRYSYPLTAGGFAAIQVFFFVHHFGLLAGLLGLKRAGVGGSSRSWRWGMPTAILGMALLTVTELAAISAGDGPYPSSQTDVLDGLYGTASVLTGIGLIASGLAVIRTKAWTGWHRLVPLSLGVFVFVPMTPSLFLGFVAARIAIGAWMLLFALLGYALIGHAATSEVSGPGRAVHRIRRSDSDLTARA